MWASESYEKPSVEKKAHYIGEQTFTLRADFQSQKEIFSSNERQRNAAEQNSLLVILSLRISRKLCCSLFFPSDNRAATERKLHAATELERNVTSFLKTIQFFRTFLMILAQRHKWNFYICRKVQRIFLGNIRCLFHLPSYDGGCGFIN